MDCCSRDNLEMQLSVVKKLSENVCRYQENFTSNTLDGDWGTSLAVVANRICFWFFIVIRNKWNPTLSVIIKAKFSCQQMMGISKFMMFKAMPVDIDRSV